MVRQHRSVPWDPLEARRAFIADHWWMAAAVLVAVGGGALMPLNHWWSSVLGVGFIVAGVVLLTLGVHAGRRGRN